MGWKYETTFLPIYIWDSLALMFLGLALYQWGFLSGRWSKRAYLLVMAVGYGIGLPLVSRRRMELRAGPSGGGTKRMRSNRPGRRKAESARGR